jgi:hypothetical protein
MPPLCLHPSLSVLPPAPVTLPPSPLPASDPSHPTRLTSLAHRRSGVGCLRLLPGRRGPRPRQHPTRLTSLAHRRSGVGSSASFLAAGGQDRDSERSASTMSRAAVTTPPGHRHGPTAPPRRASLCAGASSSLGGARP